MMGLLRGIPRFLRNLKEFKNRIKRKLCFSRNKEDNVMIWPLKIAKIIMVLGFLAVIFVIAVWLYEKRRNRGGGVAERPAPPPKQASDADKQLNLELRKKAQRIEQEMVLLIGGKTGMSMLKYEYMHPVSPEAAEACRESFMKKQKRLKEAYKEYYALRDRARNLPEGAGPQINTLQKESLYVELMNETL